MIQKIIYFSLIAMTLAPVAAQAGGTTELCQVRDSSLRYILDQQVKTDSEAYKVGEWPSQVSLSGVLRDLGLLNNGPYEDRNVFVTASVHNILAEIYLKFSRTPEIREALRIANNPLPEYQMHDGSYNFWPRAKGFEKEVHIPHFKLTDPALSGLVAVPGDADDTSVVELMRNFDNSVCTIDQQGSVGCPALNSDVDKIFSRYTDVVWDSYRNVPIRPWALPNLFRGEIWTNAFLTWAHEQPAVPLQTNALAPQKDGPRVVLDFNDVDCVVNANVIRTLAINHKESATGYKAACSLVNNDGRDYEFNGCGFYYPDTYWYHYAVARAYEDGAVCLKPGRDIALEHILKKQESDGSWHNQVIKDDDILATAFALGALIKMGDPNDPEQVAKVRKGIDYLMTHTQTSTRGNAYWKGGVFFSAGMPVRTSVLWSSDSFTTSVVMLLLYEAVNWLPEASCS